jgi:hypothetical protein
MNETVRFCHAGLIAHASNFLVGHVTLPVLGEDEAAVNIARINASGRSGLVENQTAVLVRSRINLFGEASGTLLSARSASTGCVPIARQR